MRWNDLNEESCPVARGLSVIGDRWTMLVLRDCFQGVRRFDAFQKRLGITRHVLADRLRKLESAGVLERKQYQERPPRYEYRLTEKGRDLWAVIIALKQWGDRWLGTDDTPVQITHKACGKVVRPHMTCPDCGERIEAHDAEAQLSHTFELERQAARRAP